MIVKEIERQKIIAQLVADSIWRVDIDDKETTVTGKEISSGSLVSTRLYTARLSMHHLTSL